MGLLLEHVAPDFIALHVLYRNVYYELAKHRRALLASQHKQAHNGVPVKVRNPLDRSNGVSF
jgi:hypothetical protein